MHLSNIELQNTKPWEEAEINLPHFDRALMIENTKKHPTWVHFGTGNLFRAYPAVLQQTLLNQGLTSTGIIVVGGRDPEIIDRLSRPRDDLSLLVILKADGTIKKTVIGSVAQSLKADPHFNEDHARLVEIFCHPELQMISFTITEKGYTLVNGNGDTLPDVLEDLRKGPHNTKSYLGHVAALLLERYTHGQLPLALVSMDNCSHNGTKLYEAIMTYAQNWVQHKFTDTGFIDYLNDPRKIAFTWSMIDKITPRPDAGVKRMLESIGFCDTENLITSKNTYVAPFVNAEEPQYLIIENHFPNGHPPLEKVGVIFTDRETVDKVEKMKVCTCLNPLHTALAIFGCLLGYSKISEEMKDKDLRQLVEILGYKEALPVVVDPRILSPKAFIDEVLQIRFPNPFMPDTPQRIATDTSQKVSIRFGETIKAYLSSDYLDINDLIFIPLVLAAWLRYLLGVDDSGNTFTVSPDPMLEILQKQLRGLALGQSGPFEEVLNPILSDSNLFGVNLIKAGLSDKVQSYFKEMMIGPGAVRRALQTHISNSLTR